MKTIEFILQTVFALIGAFVFSVGVGSIFTGCLRIAGVPGWLALLAYPLTLFFSCAASLFFRLFFMRFAVPIVNFWGDTLDTGDFTVRQFLLMISLLLSLPVLIFFAFVPEIWGAGVLGTLLLVNYAVRSKFMDAGWEGASKKL